MHTIAKDIFSVYLMNDSLMEIFPEDATINIFRFCIHLVAELYILEKQKEMLSETMR